MKVLSVTECIWLHAGGWFNIKMLCYQYRKSHCGDKTIVLSPQIRALVIMSLESKVNKIFRKLPQVSFFTHQGLNNMAAILQTTLFLRAQITIIIPPEQRNPPNNEVVGGYIGFTPSVRPSVRLSVRPSVHPACRVRSVTSTVLDGFFPY